jgi:hypothetical protein
MPLLRRIVFSQGMADELVMCENTPEEGVIVEADAEHVKVFIRTTPPSHITTGSIIRSDSIGT